MRSPTSRIVVCVTLLLVTSGPLRSRFAAFAQSARAANPKASSQEANLQPLPYSNGQFLLAGTNPPPPVDPAWVGVIGEYGPDHKKLYVLEKGGGLCVLAGGSGLIHLQPYSADVFTPAGNRSSSKEKLVFVRDQSEVVGLRWKGVYFPRRQIGAPTLSPRSTLLLPVTQLRQEALTSHPPIESRIFLKPDLVDLTSIDPTIKLEIRYATGHNFLGAPLYSEPRAFLQRPAGEALGAASKKFRALGYGLLVYDAYRPWYVTKMFWDSVPKEKRIFVANPRKGSRHNRGCAVDLTLYDLKTGQPVEMTGGYDEMSERSYPTYPGGTSLARWHRDLLRQVMGAEGFTVNPYEWWHFDYKDWRRYPILNTPFEVLDQRGS